MDPALFDLPFAPGPALRVAIVSSNIAKKGLADFLAVARIVHAERPGIRFLIFGPPTADLHQMQPFAPNVEFRGYAETPLAAMAEADVVMSLSKFAESFGRTVMEAMAAGRPVVCYDRGAPPRLLSGTPLSCPPMTSPGGGGAGCGARPSGRVQPGRPRQRPAPCRHRH